MMRATSGGRTVRRERPARLLELQCTGAAAELIYPEGQQGSAGLGQGLAGLGCAGRHGLSAATTAHCTRQCSGPTELPQRKSHFLTKKAL